MDESLRFCVIYVSHTSSLRECLWDEISTFFAYIQGHWMVLGDLNAYLNLFENFIRNLPNNVVMKYLIFIFRYVT